METLISMNCEKAVSLQGYRPSVRSRQQAIIQRKRREYMEYIPRLFDVDDSERTEDELAALHQVSTLNCFYPQISVDVPRTSCSGIILKNEDVQLVSIDYNVYSLN